MRLDYLRIKNFCGLEDISLDGMQSSTAITIAGPNAVGKTTVLEAIRLLKIVLAPTYSQETVDALRDMGIAVPNQSTLDIKSIARNSENPIEITTSFILDKDEIEYLGTVLAQWARQRLAGRLGIAPDEMNTKLIQYLSSPEGQKDIELAENSIKKNLKNLSETCKISPGLIINPVDGLLKGIDIFQQEALAILSTRSSGYHGIFNYFPADRAMPGGEATVQLGSQDFIQQVKSHVSIPGTKYNRLKHYLVTRFLLGEQEREELKEDFKLVFDELLHGKELADLNLSQNGRLNVLIKENSSGAIYDIDRMSSGEKGLLLTLFLMKRTTSPKGLIIIDEPELHLNTSVCKILLPFLIEHILQPLEAQAIICTHSEEILASAFDKNDCHLFHLRSGRDISRIEIQDRDEMSGALKALGTSNIDVLFTKGNLYVEGPDDEAVFRAGFSELVQGFKVIPLGGRGEVEKQIKALQEAENQKKLDSNHCFIFDYDRRLTSLNSTKLVYVGQWGRYCLENYLLDSDSIYDALRQLKKDEKQEFSRGSVGKLIEKFALDQIPLEVCKSTYSRLEPNNPGLRVKEIRDATEYSKHAEILAKRLKIIKEQLQDFEESTWITNFIEKCQENDKLFKSEWSDNWKKLCNGKEVIWSVHKHFNLRISPTNFKKHIAQCMKSRESEEWKLIADKLEDALKQAVDT